VLRVWLDSYWHSGRWTTDAGANVHVAGRKRAVLLRSKNKKGAEAPFVV